MSPLYLILLLCGTVNAQTLVTSNEVSTNTVMTLSSTQTISGSKTFQGTHNFSSTVSTITFSGWVDIGWERIVNIQNASTLQADCTAGKKTLGGGAICDSATSRIRYSYPLANGTGWYVICDSAAAGNTAYAICARIK